MSPRVAGRLGPDASSEIALGHLVDLAEQVQRDVAALDRTGLDGTATGLPSVGVSGETRVAPDRRQAFLADLGTTLQELFTRYGGPEGDAFRLTVACYPFTNAEGADHARPDHPAR